VQMHPPIRNTGLSLLKVEVLAFWRF